MDFFEKAHNLSKFDADHFVKTKASTYNVDIVALQLTGGTTDHRKNPKYKIADNLYFDLTSSCTKQEAKNWAVYFISNSLAYGIQMQDMDWVYMFLAAYDLYKELNNDNTTDLYIRFT